MTTAKNKTVKSLAVQVQMPYLVALDVGFGGLKYLSSAFPIPNIIPSAVLSGKKPSDKKFVDLETIDPTQLVVSTEEGTYFVGQHAMNVPTKVSKRTQVRDRASDPSSRVLFHTGIGLSLPHEDGDYEVYLVTGLPNEDYELAICDNLKDFLNRPFSITFHLGTTRSITKNVTIVGIEILHQPEGAVTYNRLTFDENTFLVTNDKAHDMIGVIDVGHFTTFGLLTKVMTIKQTIRT
jgi:hypothetical protein